MDRNFRKILALIDYSPASIHAAEEAALIASRFDSELQLMHICSPQSSNSSIASSVAFFEAEESAEDDYYQKVEQLEKVKRDLKKNYNVTIGCIVDQGNFLEVIMNHVRQFSIDLIVLGTKKRNWIRNFFLASKAKLLIKYIDCDVLSISPASKGKAFKTILVPVGRSVPKQQILIGFDLAKKFAAKIHLIGVNKKEIDFDEKSTAALISSYRFLRDMTNMPIECTRIIGKNLSDAVVRYAEVIDADLILVDEAVECNQKKKSFLRLSIINNSNIPVLNVHSISRPAKSKSRA